MRKFVLLVLLTGFFTTPLFSQKKQDVVVTIGKEKILTNDFRKIYERNNGNILDPAEKKNPEEYLDLYVNFKLKVLEAMAIGLDTSQVFIEELAGYRAELAAPYLTDISYNEKLVEETYRRMANEVNASHILITFSQDPSPQDTLEAYRKILEVKAEVEKGLDFNQAATKYSQDPSAAQNNGNLGWFTVFQMVTPFEDAAYRTPVGKISEPVRTRFGYHLLKVHDLREAKGEIKVAHIMKMFPPDITPEVKQGLKKTIDSLYTLVQNGADFAELARNNSDDQRSAVNGGEMPFFGRSRMIPEFSEPAFALKKDGDVTQPVETDFGFHIIKRIELKSVPEFDAVKRELEERIKRDPERTTQSREIFISKLKKEYGFNSNQKLIDEKITKASGWFTQGNLSVPENVSDTDVLFTLAGKNFIAQDWFAYLTKMPISAPENPRIVLEAQYVAWEEDAIIEFEDSRLEEKHPEFRSLMQEYHDGLLLFAVSEQKIWQQASADTVGLKNFYETNKQKYMWGERFKGMIVTCINAAIKDEVEDKLDQGIPLEEIYDMGHINEDFITVETGAWAKGDNGIIDFYIWNGSLPAGLNSETGFVKGEIAGPEPKLLEEARGFHISDYQQYLEENWLKELKKKYPVKVNRKVLKSIANV
jgi:peptidyl-prolyl cis-trans isomerase SurA